MERTREEWLPISLQADPQRRDEGSRKGSPKAPSILVEGKRGDGIPTCSTPRPIEGTEERRGNTHRSYGRGGRRSRSTHIKRMGTGDVKILTDARRGLNFSLHQKHSELLYRGKIKTSAKKLSSTNPRDRAHSSLTLCSTAYSATCGVSFWMGIGDCFALC